MAYFIGPLIQQLRYAFGRWWYISPDIRHGPAPLPGSVIEVAKGAPMQLLHEGYRELHWVVHFFG